ncbi:MAG: DUF1838 family protein [Cyanobacteria bacterium P01_F01_bin.42]
MSHQDVDYTYSSLDYYRKNHGKQLYYNWSGDIWWTLDPDQGEQKLFSIIGMNATKVFLKMDPDRGEMGHRLNRELALYCDPDTHEVLSHWQNPAGETVSVVHIANRMVQGSLLEKFITVPRGQDYIAKETKFPLEYPHPLAEDSQFRAYCPGKTFNAQELFTSHFARPGVTDVPPAAWNRDCPWLPWMKLGFEHPARLRFSTTIQRVETFDELHPNLVSLVRDRLPMYEFTPDVCDEPNMTSLKYFKRYFSEYLEGQRFPVAES